MNVLQYQRNNETTTGASISTTESPDVLDFHESTTALYGKDATGHFIDASIDAQSYSKIAYVSAVVNGYEQEVNNMCGRDYLSKFLVGHNLDITNRVFSTKFNWLYIIYIVLCICLKFHTLYAWLFPDFVCCSGYCNNVVCIGNDLPV